MRKRPKFRDIIEARPSYEAFPSDPNWIAGHMEIYIGGRLEYLMDLLEEMLDRMPSKEASECQADEPRAEKE